MRLTKIVQCQKLNKMIKYKKIYCEFFGYQLNDFIPSEISGEKLNEIHHIDCKGMGGSKEKDFIENLIAVTRDQHSKFGDKKQYMEFLYTTHLKFIRDQRPKYKIQYNKIPQAYREAVRLEVENN